MFQCLCIEHMRRASQTGTITPGDDLPAWHCKIPTANAMLEEKKAGLLEQKNLSRDLDLCCLFYFIWA